ncbi:MAG TPA: hypothetical protein DGG95_17685 [Cytophagales bacterium]|jgi:hypothetical protein|nr:hypothetical protein [Cytophagales bacterium]
MKIRNILLGSVAIGIIIFYIITSRGENISIEPLKKFALTYEPCNDQVKKDSLKDSEICFQPPVPPDEVLTVLNKRKVDEEYKKWVLLIYLKLYEKQIILYHQSFETRDSPFFIKRFQKRSAMSKAFCETIGESALERKLGPEFLPASKAYEFILEKKLFFDDSEIQSQLRSIDNLLKRQ